jgi:hypothetical protein
MTTLGAHFTCAWNILTVRRLGAIWNRPERPKT